VSAQIDIELTRQALASSTLSHGLGILGDRWTVQVLMGTFMGLKRFEQWQQQLGLPRSTLAERLRSLSAIGPQGTALSGPTPEARLPRHGQDAGSVPSGPHDLELGKALGTKRCGIARSPEPQAMWT